MVDEKVEKYDLASVSFLQPTQQDHKQDPNNIAMSIIS